MLAYFLLPEQYVLRRGNSGNTTTSRSAFFAAWSAWKGQWWADTTAAKRQRGNAVFGQPQQQQQQQQAKVVFGALCVTSVSLGMASNTRTERSSCRLVLAAAAAAVLLLATCVCKCWPLVKRSNPLRSGRWVTVVATSLALKPIASFVALGNPTLKRLRPNWLKNLFFL